MGTPSGRLRTPADRSMLLAGASGLEPMGPAVPPSAVANEAGVALDGPRPSRKLVPSPVDQRYGRSGGRTQSRLAPGRPGDLGAGSRRAQCHRAGASPDVQPALVGPSVEGDHECLVDPAGDLNDRLVGPEPQTML